ATVLTADLAATAKRDRGHHDPVEPERDRRGRNSNDVRDRIQRADLVKVHRIRLDSMRRRLRPSQPRKRVQSACPYGVLQPSYLDQSPNLSPSPSPTLMPVLMTSLVPMPVTVPMPGVRDALRMRRAVHPH